MIQTCMICDSFVKHKRDSSPKNENSVIKYSCRSMLRYFWWNPRAFLPSIDSNTTDTFKAQKGNKDIVKIVHVT